MRRELKKADLKLSLMEWETTLLGRKIGRVEGVVTDDDMIQSVNALKQIEKQARTADFELLIMRVKADHWTTIWALETSGFLLSDVGVTFQYEVGKSVIVPKAITPENLPGVREAKIEDIPALEKMAAGLFLNSYYYVSPFFSGSEADILFQTWMRNCVRRERADKVLVIETSDGILGFITCRSLANNVGIIDLIGVRKNYTSRGIGKTLIKEALEYFKELGTTTVRVRTQITNIASVNTYLTTGAHLTNVDATFGKSLNKRGI